MAFFAPVAGIMIAVGAFISLDTLLGMMAAHKTGEKIESKKLSRVVWKMVMYQSVVLTFFVMDVFIVGDLLGQFVNTSFVLTKAVGVALIGIEFKSIDEALNQAEKLDSLHKKKSREEYRTHFSVNGVSWTQDARIPNNHMAHAANNQYAYGQRQQTDNQRQQQRAQSPRQRRQGYRCLQCNSANHLMRNCPQVDWTALQSVQCGTCGQLGHSSKLCLVSYWRGDEVKGQAPSMETTGTDQKPSPSQ